MDGARVAIASASYGIEKPQIPENRKRSGKKIGKIGEKLENNRSKIENSYFFAYFPPIFWASGSFYSVAGQRGLQFLVGRFGLSTGQKVDQIGPGQSGACEGDRALRKRVFLVVKMPPFRRPPWGRPNTIIKL